MKYFLLLTVLSFCIHKTTESFLEFRSHSQSLHVNFLFVMHSKFSSIIFFYFVFTKSTRLHFLKCCGMESNVFRDRRPKGVPLSIYLHLYVSHYTTQIEQEIEFCLFYNCFLSSSSNCENNEFIYWSYDLLFTARTFENAFWCVCNAVWQRTTFNHFISLILNAN